MTSDRVLKSWDNYPRMAGESRRSRRLRRAADDPDYKAHLQAVERLPSAVKEAWDLYLNDKKGELYPFGFSYHFPRQWRWKELQDEAQRGVKSISQRALEAAGLDAGTARRPDGTVDRWPSGRPMATNSPGIDEDFDEGERADDVALWRDEDGTTYLIDRSTGEILGEWEG